MVFVSTSSTKLSTQKEPSEEMNDSTEEGEVDDTSEGAETDDTSGVESNNQPATGVLDAPNTDP